MDKKWISKATSRWMSICAALPFITAQAAIFEFNLTGPAGSGLLPGNEVQDPAVVSSGSGQEDDVDPVYGGIFYDDSNSTFTFYGSYQNLSSTFQAAHIHGPADTTQNATVVLGLTHNSLGAGAGQIDAVGVSITETQRQQLFDGEWYANVHSDNYPNGELRGQLTLTPVPEPETYALMAGMALLGFAGFRRYMAGMADG